MKHRTENPKAHSYRWYGAIGISVCDEWKDSFQAFQDWAMRAGYDPGAPRGKCTLVRIDPSGDYFPENCRWVDMHVQNSNKRKAERSVPAPKRRYYSTKDIQEILGVE
jgi:hypothetical protein